MSDVLRGFSGFTAGKTRFTPIPNEFFGEVLPLIDDLDELKAVLYAFWRLSQGEGEVRYVRLDDVLTDLLFLSGLSGPEEERAEAARRAFARAAQRGILLEITIRRRGREEIWYFLNSPKGREGLARLQRGEFTGFEHDIDDIVIGLEKERPNIFLLYEQNIGMITPLLAEKLRQAERDYPENWLRDAFSLAVERNKRSWAYIQSILRQWAEHGKDTPAQTGRALAPSPGTVGAGEHDESAPFILE